MLKNKMFLWIFSLYLIHFIPIKVSVNGKNVADSNANLISFQVVKNKSSFWEAKRSCLKEYNSYLVIIKSQEESNKISEMLSIRNISSAWIGLADFGREQKFYWANDHSSSSFEMWEKGYPKDDRNASDCVLMRRNDDGVFKWVDCHCATKHAFICMKTNVTESVKPTLLPSHSHYLNQCPEPFTPVDGDCFWMSSQLLSWDESRLLCRSKSSESDLASIRTDFQQEYFAALLTGSSTGYWIGLNYYDNAYQWILQHDVKNTRWGQNQPKDAIKKNCAFIGVNEHNLGNWYTAFCSDKFYALCQTLMKNNDSETSNRINASDITYDDFLFKKDACQKPGYYYYHGSCYRLHYDTQLSHNEAVKFCNNQSFHNKSGYNFLVELISLPTAGEKNFILADLRRLGSDLQKSTVWLNIRGNETENMSSEKLEADKVIPLKRVKHLCFKLLTNGIVNSSDCDDNSQGIPMCKYQLNNFNLKALKSNRLLATCPQGWTLFNSFCYLFDTTTYKSQYEAKKSCLKLNGNLISIDMYLEGFLANFLKKKIYTLNTPDVWIGLEAKNTFDDRRLDFKWMDESPVTYLNLESTNVTGNLTKWCTVFVVKLGLWRLISCTKYNAMVVCHQKANIATISYINKDNASKKISKFQKPGYIFKSDLLSWKAAYNNCRNIKTEPGFISTLATIDSYQELYNMTNTKELKEMSRKNHWHFGIPYHRVNSSRSLEILRKALAKNLQSKRNRRFQYAWIGLSGLYDRFDNVYLHWADESNVVFQNYQWENLMNLSGTENCVMMDLWTGKWFASDCNVKRPYYCQVVSKQRNQSRKSESRLSQLLPDKEDIATLTCPDGFHEYFQKCYRVIEDEPMEWKSADNYCQTLVPEKYSKRASLASIESRFENSFVYSLLSSNIHSINDTRYWIGERYVHLCAGISSHPDPYIGARWFTEECNGKRKFICSSLKIPNYKSSPHVTSCPTDEIEYNNTLGTFCYHFEDFPNTFEEARNYCGFRNPKSLLTLPSHYHLHFLLSQTEKFGWSRDSPIWLGAELEQSQKFTHWQWDNGQDVRYTIWNKVPNLSKKTNGPLCLFLLPEKDKSGRFGLQVEECQKLSYKGYIVCESTKEMLQAPKIAPNRNCLDDSMGDSYEGDMNNTVNGLKCLRWDLLKRPNLVIKSMRHDLNKHSYVQYHSNECRYISQMQPSTTSCLISLSTANGSLSLQECNVGLCSHILHHTEVVNHEEERSNVMTVIIVTLLLLISVVACIALLSWRRWNKTSLFGGYLRRGQFSMLNGGNQSRGGTSFNNPIYSPVNC